MLAAAISAGACVTWSTPIGGVLLAMELSATHFFVGNIMKSLLASTIGIIVLSSLYTGFGQVKATKHSHFESLGLNYEIFFFMLLGWITSKVGVLFNHVLTKLLFLRVKLKNPFISNRWKWCTLVSLFISIISFPIPAFHFGEKSIFEQLIQEKDLSQLPSKNEYP